MNRKRQSRAAAVAGGVAAGAIGGLIASFVMNEFQAGLSKLEEAQVKSRKPRESSEGGDDATVKTAAAISETVFDHALTKKEKEEAGPAVHYAFGASVGALYGAIAALEPRIAGGWGMPFGAGLWLVADEVAVPALGLSKSPVEYPASKHASAFAAHLVYGLSVDVVRRLFQTALREAA